MSSELAGMGIGEGLSLLVINSVFCEDKSSQVTGGKKTPDETRGLGDASFLLGFSFE